MTRPQVQTPPVKRPLTQFDELRVRLASEQRALPVLGGGSLNFGDR